jgi:branched-chain amino acid aminotransferase
LKLPFQEADMTRYVGCNADECFLDGTAGEVISVVKLDGREIGDAKPGRLPSVCGKHFAVAFW